MTVRRYPYPEILDRLLVAVIGGVAGETHPFPPHRHLLQRPPVADITSVHGARDGQPHRFRKDVDFALGDDGRSLVWLEDGAQHPDEGTLVSVSYLPAGVAPELTDVQVGSVLRTMLETIALEFATVSAQLEAVYRSGFVDTATGSSLDRVVALLGIERITAGRAAGEVEMRRAPEAVGTITIPAGTRVATADGAISYETVEEATVLPGQRTLRVPVRDLEPTNEGLPADSLVVMPAPVAGITAVTNPAPTTVASRDETDDALRRRAKRFLHGSERATLGALRQAVATQGVVADVAEDPAAPGFVDVTPHAAVLTPEVRLRLETALHDARPAGVVVRLHDAQPPRQVHVTLRLETAEGLLAADRRAIQRRARAAIEDFFSSLEVRSPASTSRIVALVAGLDGVTDVRIVSATWTAPDAPDPDDVLDLGAGLLQIGGAPTVLGELRIADPALATRLGVVITSPTTVEPVSRPAIEADLDAAVAALNALNAADDAPAGARDVGYARLRALLRLPDQPGATLAAVDGGAVAATAGEASPYRVRFLLTQETGLVVVLSAAADSYALTPFERLARDAVELVEEEPDG